MIGKKNFFGSAFLLFIFWVAITGSFDYRQLAMGAVAGLFVAWFNRDLLITLRERPPVSLRSPFVFLTYCLHLAVEVIKANFQVAAIVLHPKMPIQPDMVKANVAVRKDATRVALATSITLTPGTLTVLAGEGEFLVHALTKEAGRSLEDNRVAARLAALEEEPL